MLRLLVGATLVAATLAIALPQPVVRVFEVRDFRGTFTSRFRFACPVKIFHQDVVKPGGNAIRHNAISIDGTVCANNGQMDLFPLSVDQRVQAALSRYDGISKDLAVKLVENARKISGSYMGVAPVPRNCGSLTLAAGTVFIFTKTENGTTFDTGAPGLPPIDTGRRVMVYIQPGATFFCPYDAKLREPLKPSPTAVPVGTTVSPSPSASFDPMATPGPDVDGNGEGTVAEPTPTPSVSPTPEPPICFPADATVQTADGSAKAMKHLKVGDRVRVAGGKYSEVFMFTHKMGAVRHQFVRLTTADGASITLTRGHYLLVNGAMRPARSVVRGDVLTLADGSTSSVATIDSVMGDGLYNPQTVDGSIVVNGVLASTYTTAVEMQTAHSMLAPLRAVYNFFGLSMTALESGADNIANILPNGAAVY